MNMNQGYITLISVIVVGAVGVAVGVALVLSGLASARTSFAVEQSNQAKGLAHACAEEALQRIRDNTSYTGGDNFALGQGTCSYTVVSTGGESRTIQAIGSVDIIIRKVEILVGAINPQIEIVSWQEVSDF